MEFDLRAVFGLGAPIMVAGFYNKTFKWPSWHWYEGMIRRSAGSGRLPEDPDAGIIIEVKYAKEMKELDAACEAAISRPGQRGKAVNRRPVERLPQLRARLDEGRARHMQPHHLHHHLVGVGGAVEGAGAGRVIAADLAFQQGLTIHLVLRILGPYAGLLRVRNARRHRA